MSDNIRHECGLAFVRLRKPLQFYIDKYGTPLYGLNKLYLLMEKQRNRGQDGAGVAAVKINSIPGNPYIFRQRSIHKDASTEIFGRIQQHFIKASANDKRLMQNGQWLHDNVPFAGNLLLGHLRYGTHSANTIHACHPFLRQNNWMCRNLVLAGNFNMTNNDLLFQKLVSLGQHPRASSDTVTVLEKIGHFLDEENERLYRQFKSEGYSRKEITGLISENISIPSVLRHSARDFDGGYVMIGMVGHGDAFVLRDPAGIRPVSWYEDDEVVVVASERPAIQTAFQAPLHKINEVQPGHALVVRRNGELSESQILDPLPRRSCSFERIYFSRGTDAEIYQERKALGRHLVKTVLKAVNYDLKNTVFSFIPNTAEMAFMGMGDGLHAHLDELRNTTFNNGNGGNGNASEMKDLLSQKVRLEKIAVKDVKMRTFITDDENRGDLVSHVYDTAYGVVRPGKDTLVALDDSIVRGTTLKKSILTILDRLGPKKIIIVSSAPQIRYPDCYGIDMSKLGQFVAFQALMSLLKEKDMLDKVHEVYKKCKESENLPADQVQSNYLRELYKCFTTDEISDRIAQIIRPPHLKAELQVIYQSIEDLHKACPNHQGDWYFTGLFPTPGGNRVVNRAFINYFEGKNVRAY